MKTKVNVLLCDRFEGILPERMGTYMGMFERLLEETCEVEEYAAFEGELPEISAGGCYLITGCNRGVYERETWIENLLGWVREAWAKRAKIVGVCFGHQAVAQALGGKVQPADAGWGAGMYAEVVGVVDVPVIQTFMGKEMHLLHNHHDQVVCAPEGLTVWATSAFCPIGGLCAEGRVLTFQGHPEYTREYMLHLLEHHAAGEDPETTRRAKAELADKAVCAQVQRDARRAGELIGAFFSGQTEGQIPWG